MFAKRREKIKTPSSLSTSRAFIIRPADVDGHSENKKVCPEGSFKSFVLHIVTGSPDQKNNKCSAGAISELSNTS